MTIAESLDTLRLSIKEVTDDSKYTDSYLYGLWKLGRAKFLGRRMKQSNVVSPWTRQRFCLELERAKGHDCGCIQVGCDVLRSKKTIPRALTNRHKPMYQVQTLDGILIPARDERETLSSQYDPIKNGKTSHWIYNNHLVIYNNLALKAVQAHGVWEDPLEWEDSRFCPEARDCFDIMEFDAGLDAELEEVVLRNTMELLQLPLNRQDDNAPNRNAEIR